MDIPSPELAAFRLHRHDVLNDLQLIRAYIQMGRPEQALGAVDHLADWLASLGIVQNMFGDLYNELFWLMATCAYVRIADGVQPLLSGAGRHLEEFKRVVVWLNQQAQMHGVKLFVVSGEIPNKPSEATGEWEPQSRLRVRGVGMGSLDWSDFTQAVEGLELIAFKIQFDERQ